LSQKDIIEVFQRVVERPVFQDLEITSSGLGFRNALSVFVDSPHLDTLKLRGIQPDWTQLEGEGDSNLPILNRPLPPLPYPFTSTLSKLVLWECRLDTGEFTNLCTSLSSSTALRQLILHRLESREPQLGRSAIPFPSPALITSLTPLVPQLDSFHLVLPLSASASTPPLPLDVISTHFPTSLKTLVLEGPRLLSSSTLFENLIACGKADSYQHDQSISRNALSKKE
jgi:hypothetical protein